MSTRRHIVLIGAPVLALAAAAAAQDRFEALPGHDRFEAVSEALREVEASGRLRDIQWSGDGTELRYRLGGKSFLYDLGTHELVELPPPDEGEPQPGRRGDRPPRGRQREREPSPDGAWVAVCRDHNVILEPADGGRAVKVTAGGNRALGYGRADWVYGEELDQATAMWWSPDSSRLAFYELDETAVADYALATGHTQRHGGIAVEGYPLSGEPNPVAGLLIWDVAKGRASRVDVGPQREQYVFDVRYSPDGRTLLFNRTNRPQNVLELVAVDLASMKSRVVCAETQRTWQRNRPLMRWLADGHRFVWETEKTGMRQYELRDLDGRLVTPLTRGRRPAGDVVRIVEPPGAGGGAGALYYMAFSGPCPLNAQLHRVGLDGGDDVRLTAEGSTHEVRVSPDGRWFVDTAESLSVPPSTALYASDGTRIATLAEADPTPVRDLGIDPAELFTFKADDGVTDLYGVLYRPSGFDPRRSYPLLIDVYGGPESQRVRNRYRPADPHCELGFCIAVIDNRGTAGRGKAFEEAVYLQCGGVDLEDQVDGARFLLEARPWLDRGRVGIFGHSYGGYMAALAILKHPDVFSAAVAASPVTDWRNYDTIYTERYMRAPQENPAGYDEGSCLTHAGGLQGRLLLMHGMADANVHPSNSWQLVDALQKAGKRFDMAFFPDAAHRLPPAARGAQWEFLQEALSASPCGR